MGFFDDVNAYNLDPNADAAGPDRAAALPQPADRPDLAAPPPGDLDTPAGMSEDFSAKRRRPSVSLPLPRPRPAEFGPSAYTPAAPQPLSGILLGSSPSNAQRFIASLGAGLSNVRNSPFPGQTFANAAGAGLIRALDDSAYNRRLATLDRALRSKSPMQGAGTQASPFLPLTSNHYATIGSGNYYVHPETGLLMRKP